MRNANGEGKEYRLVHHVPRRFLPFLLATSISFGCRVFRVSSAFLLFVILCVLLWHRSGPTVLVNPLQWWCRGGGEVRRWKRNRKVGLERRLPISVAHRKCDYVGQRFCRRKDERERNTNKPGETTDVIWGTKISLHKIPAKFNRNFASRISIYSFQT